jgi:hypothetical protein
VPVSAGRPQPASIPINPSRAKPEEKVRLNVAFILIFSAQIIMRTSGKQPITLSGRPIKVSDFASPKLNEAYLSLSGHCLEATCADFHPYIDRRSLSSLHGAVEVSSKHGINQFGYSSSGIVPGDQRCLPLQSRERIRHSYRQAAHRRNA